MANVLTIEETRLPNKFGSVSIDFVKFPVKFEKSDSDDHSFAEEKTRICFQGEVLLNNRVTAEDHFQETRLIRNGLKINSLLVTSHPFYFVNSNSLKSNFEFS